MNAKKEASGQSMLWGYPTEYWDIWGLRLMWAGAGFGALTVFVSLASSVILYQVANIAQSELVSKTGQLELALKTQERLTAEAKAESNKSALELEKVRRQIAPRILSNEQQEKLASKLLPFGRPAVEYGRQKVLLISYGMDTEAAVLGSQLLLIFQRVGIFVENSLASELPLGSFAVGVHIAGSNNGLTLAIAEALSEVGDIEVTLGTRVPSVNPNANSVELAAVVLVGTRPVRIEK